MGRLKKILIMINAFALVSVGLAVENLPSEKPSLIWEKVELTGKVDSVYMAPSPKNPEVNHFCVRLRATDGKTYEVRFGKKELPIVVGDEIKVRGGWAPQFGDVVEAMFAYDITTGFKWHRWKKSGSEGGWGVGSENCVGDEFKSGGR
ncbi:MAG: hypothetical protein ACUVWP_07470 [bacterium]